MMERTTVPSPVGHSLTGLALAGLTQYLRNRQGHAWPLPALRRGPATSLPLLALALAAAACAPDLDFIPGVLVGDPNWLHRGLSHSLAASRLCGGVSLLDYRDVG
jgi:hypothetical protein